MPTPRHRRAAAVQCRRGGVTPYSEETQQALMAFIEELAAMPKDALLVFQGLLNGRTLDEIAAVVCETRLETRAIIDKAVREHPLVADVYGANGFLLEAGKE